MTIKKYNDCKKNVCGKLNCPPYKFDCKAARDKYA